MTNMRMRVLLIGAVLLLSMAAIVPLDQRIRLGLDLQGGVRLVLRVNTDEALQLDTQAAADRLREGLLERGVRFSTVRVEGPLEFLVEGVEDANVLRGLVADDEYEQQGGGGTYVFRLRPDAERGLRLQTVERALATVERRVNELGVAEPTIVRHHRQDHIDVQLPGVSDVERARQIIRSTAQLRLTLIEQGPFDSLDAALGAYPSGVPPTLDVLPSRPAGDGTPEAYYVVQAAPALTGRDLRRAHVSVDERNRPAVGFTLTADAARRFGSFTAAHIGRSLATVVDGRVRSVATIASRIDDRGQVTNLTREEMLEQVITLNAGALPASMDYVGDHTVGPSLGADAVRAGMTASLAGLAMVIVFMVAWYRTAGLIAVTSLALNLIVLLALLVAVGAVMTLPGIAGLILTIGIGIDSNVLIFERIREELAAARGPRAAVGAGFHRVWRTIVDTHLASLIAAAVLFQVGTGPIRGFATTLALGLIANVFTAVFVSRTIFDLILSQPRMAGGVRL
jgi:preprotein translocase subunit SecD